MELTNDQVLAKANRAKQLLEDELFKEAILAAEAVIIDQWRNTEDGPNGTAEREATYYRLRAISSVVLEIRRVMEGGDFLLDQLEKQKRHEQ